MISKETNFWKHDIRAHLGIREEGRGGDICENNTLSRFQIKT